MNESKTIAKAVELLKVSEQTMQTANIQGSDLGKSSDFVHKLFIEWLNDTLVFYGEKYFKDCAKDPDKAFLNWLSERFKKPYHVTFRATDTIRVKYGGETALLFSEVRWFQEVAWAQKMRESDNDRICFLAEMWLKAAERDPKARFIDIIDCYANSACFDPMYSDNPVHMLCVQEIYNSNTESYHWNPLWLRFAEKEFGKMINSMPRNKLNLLAQQVRQSAYNERCQTVIKDQISFLKQYPPSRMIGVLTVALQKGLNSDDILLCEKKFLTAVQKGTIELNSKQTPFWRTFLKTLENYMGTAPAPDQTQSEQRIKNLEQTIDPVWDQTLPTDFIRLGAQKPINLLSWYNEIVKEKTRLPPEDPVIDYGMWLVENA